MNENIPPAVCRFISSDLTAESPSACLPGTTDLAGRRLRCAMRTAPFQGGQGLRDITAHRGCSQPEQGPECALNLHPLDHPDTSSGHWLEQVVEDDLAQGHRA